MPRFFLHWVVGMLMIARSSHAEAQVAEPTVMLDWSSDEGCLDREGFIAAVTEALPRNPIVQEQGDATIVGQAEREENGSWSLLFVVLDRQGTQLGERRLQVESPTCVALKEHVVVVGVMLVDSTLRSLSSAGPMSTPSEAVAEAPRAAAVVARANSVVAVAPTAPRDHAMRLSMGASGDANRLPSTSLGLRVGVGWGRAGQTELSLEASLHPAALVIAPEGGESTISWKSVSLAACHSLWRPTWLEFAACAGVRIGAMGAKGRGFARNREPYEVVVDGQIEALGRRRLGTRFFVCAALASYVALRRPRFGYENSSGAFATIHEPATFALDSTIAFGVSFF